MEKELTLTERNDLQYLEQIVEKGLSSFIEVGEALWKIREEKLYRAEFKTFENYCKVRWGISRIHAHRLIDGVEVVKLLPIGNKITTESQARELAKVPTEKREEVVEQTVKRDGKLTARGIKETATETAPVEVIEEKKPVGLVGFAMGYAEGAINNLKKIPHNDIDRERALRKVLSYIKNELK